MRGFAFGILDPDGERYALARRPPARVPGLPRPRAVAARPGLGAAAAAAAVASRGGRRRGGRRRCGCGCYGRRDRCRRQAPARVRARAPRPAGAGAGRERGGGRRRRRGRRRGLADGGWGHQREAGGRLPARGQRRRGLRRPQRRPDRALARENPSPSSRAHGLRAHVPVADEALLSSAPLGAPLSSAGAASRSRQHRRVQADGVVRAAGGSQTLTPAAKAGREFGLEQPAPSGLLQHTHLEPPRSERRPGRGDRLRADPAAGAGSAGTSSARP